MKNIALSLIDYRLESLRQQAKEADRLPLALQMAERGRINEEITFLTDLRAEVEAIAERSP